MNVYYVVDLYLEELGCCYQSVNVISLGLFQSDHIKLLNVITLVQWQTDDINQMITKTE